MDNSTKKESPLKRIAKADYAMELGITTETLRKMLNFEFIRELKKLGYKPNQKYITLAQKQKLEELAVNINLD